VIQVLAICRLEVPTPSSLFDPPTRGQDVYVVRRRKSLQRRAGALATSSKIVGDQTVEVVS
jgi:hypothetical protein